MINELATYGWESMNVNPFLLYLFLYFVEKREFIKLVGWPRNTKTSNFWDNNLY